MIICETNRRKKFAPKGLASVSINKAPPHLFLGGEHFLLVLPERSKATLN
jgi:hypothetical protein